jgi:diguanylate cyclase (GGDEF)-like protein/PAS domain S-box-containing protein
MLADVLALRRAVYIGVYVAVSAALGVYVVLGFTPLQVGLIALISWIISGLAIHVSFVHLIRLRKRSSYPALLMLNVADAATSVDAATCALQMVERMLTPQTAFIALIPPGGAASIVATHGMTAEAAADRLELLGETVETALDVRYPIEVPSRVGDIHVMIVPIVALKKPIGALYLAGRSHADLADRPLLCDIGAAIGISLESLRQRELLFQKDSRLRSAITGAPIVLFSIDKTGICGFIEGNGLDRLNTPPEGVVGRSMEDIFGSYPQVLHSFRRAFSGESVTAIAEIRLQDEGSLIFEYRLVPERDEKGRVVGIIGVAHDITERKRAEEALVESQRALETLVANLPGFAYRCRNDRDWTMEYVSEGVRDITGYDPEDFTSGNVFYNDLIHPDDREAVWMQVQAAVVIQDSYRLEYRLVGRDGVEKWIWEQGQAHFDDNGEIVALEGFINEVSERKRAEQALAESEERYRDLFENARDGIFTYDLNGGLVSTNRRFAEMCGYTLAEMTGVSADKLFPVASHHAAAEGMARIFRGESSSFEVDILRKDGQLAPLDIAARIIVDAAGRPVFAQGIARDISERRQAEETIRRLAYHDGLTGLPNRALLEDRLGVSLAQARRENKTLALMFLDLDSFKVVNDTLGHSAGDRLLESVAADLALIIREGDTLARVGGDEFTVLLPAMERIEDATDVAERILECLRRPRTVDGQEFRPTGSIGITTFPADGLDAATLLRNADTAMYRAKDKGRDNYQLYTRSMNEWVMERLSFENDLRHAIERDQLKLYYQPILDTTTGELMGAEALLRWRHPERGIVPPDSFIPFAEESGLIIEMGEWVLRRACRRVVLWEQAGYSLPRIAVNLSARQLQQEDLVERVQQVVAESGLRPDRIQLEITEGAVLRDEDRIIGTLNALREMGIGIALDDFGTGYSSLTYLKRFPIDAVKIDRSFVRDLERDASDAAIVSTVVAMAENLRLKVIAEGVETEAQLAFLRERRCDEFQGYLVSAAVSSEDFVPFFSRAPGAERSTNGVNGKTLRPARRR